MTRLRAMKFKFETYMINLKHTMLEHLRVLSPMICDLKPAVDNLSYAQQVIVTIQSLAGT